MHVPAPHPTACDATQIPKGGRHGSRGFTLTELLVVVSVIILMMSMAIPAFNAIRGGTDFGSVVYDVAGILDQSRAYAMAHNTFVLVGIMELNGAQSSSVNPQATGVGRIAIAAIASKDGGRPYQTYLDNSRSGGSPNITSAGPSISGAGSAYTPISKLITFNNVHIADLQGATASVPASGNMARPAVLGYFDVGNTTQCVSATPFGWPLGTTVGGTPTPQYSFSQAAGWGTVIEFDPDGSARIITSQPGGNPLLDAIPQQIEIGLEPAKGTYAAAVTNEATGQIAAIQIDGMSGAVRIYRP